MPFIRVLITACVVGLPSIGTAACLAQSGSGTTALVELYTSEGCSSCPPADRQLAQLRRSRALVPLALHVGYWDELGWKDPFAQEDFAHRQSWLVGLSGKHTLYTPQFFVAGKGARPAAVAARVREVNERSPQASIRLQAQMQGKERLAVSASAQSAVDGAALYVALAESGLSTQVRHGENAGRRLSHDHVVRTWIGPLRLEDGRIELHRNLPLASSWRRLRLELSAFVQEQGTGRVLQAVGANGCFEA